MLAIYPRRLEFFSVLFLAMAACSTPPRVAAPEVQTWGTMREVLRQGHSEGRVLLAELGRRNQIGVGALAGLAGEVTIVDGRVLVATADGPVEAGAAPTPNAVRGTIEGEQASLLVLAEVNHWDAIALPDCASYEELEVSIAGACPIATPDGSAPWRYAGAGGEVELIGFYVEGAAGQLTHHNHSSHLHAIAEGGQLMGHLDEIAIREIVLLLPVE